MGAASAFMAGGGLPPLMGAHPLCQRCGPPRTPCIGVRAHATGAAPRVPLPPPPPLPSPLFYARRRRPGGGGGGAGSVIRPQRVRAAAAARRRLPRGGTPPAGADCDTELETLWRCLRSASYCSDLLLERKWSPPRGLTKAAPPRAALPARPQVPPRSISVR